MYVRGTVSGTVNTAGHWACDVPCPPHGFFFGTWWTGVDSQVLLHAEGEYKDMHSVTFSEQ